MNNIYQGCNYRALRKSLSKKVRELKSTTPPYRLLTKINKERTPQLLKNSLEVREPRGGPSKEVDYYKWKKGTNREKFISRKVPKKNKERGIAV